jgi:hypothetical protein
MKEKKEKYKLWVVRREAFSVYDEPGHTLMIVEMEGEPIEYEKGVAGKFVSRRSVTVHDRVGGHGLMDGYVMAYFEHGAAYSRFKGHRDGSSRISEGTWETYRTTGKLAGKHGRGKFKISPGEHSNEYILDLEGDYEAA